MRVKILFCCFLIFNSIVFGQAESIQLNVLWKEHRLVLLNDEELKLPDFEGAELDHGLPSLYWFKQLKNKNFSANIQNYSTVNATADDIRFFEQMNYTVTNEFNGTVKISEAGDKYFAVLHVVPFIREEGVIKRITELNFEIKQIVAEQFSYEKDFASSSVLSEGSGIWYKIAVTRDGIHRIDKSFLESCGINTTNLNPAHIHIYGNGDGKLPELNSAPRTDDLAKNAIFIQGEADGSFDQGDYLLFYAWGPHRWNAIGSTHFDQDRNIYSDISCYYININANEAPLRIENLSSTGSPANHITSDYDYFDIHENDLVSLVKGGQRWYGELFDIELERTFTFNVPNIVTTESVRFRTAIGTNARSSTGTQQRYSVNNILIDEGVLPFVGFDFSRSARVMTLNAPAATMNFKINITRNSPNVLVYLDRIVLNARRQMIFFGSQFNFRDMRSVGVGNVTEFGVSSFPTNGFVWDVTDRHTPKRIIGNPSGGNYVFRLHTDSLREFVASNGVSFFTPDRVGPVNHQNIHGLPNAELLIVTHKDFIGQANRLADLHRETGISVHVLTTEQIFNEFSSGMNDPTAIRTMAKMFFERGMINPVNRIRNLLLFGDGTYDPKNRVANNNYFVPTYQVENSENHIAALVTDDYFGLLSDSDAIAASDMLDIGVGRLLVTDQTTAKQQVDKIEHYLKNGSQLFAGSGASCCCGDGDSNSTFGDWRLNYVQIADDEEGGYFITQDTEPQYNHVKNNHPDMNCDKLYTDAYVQVSTAGGQRYPDVYEAITNRIERGALVVNYVGHGGEVGLAEERIVTIPQIQAFRNIDRLNVFVSATCEFTKYDDPGRVSAGEWMSLNPTGGAIALMTTSRSVYFGVNTITGRRFFETVFTRDANNQPLDFGEIMRLTKNASGSSDNKRSFTLIGDPALRIALPQMRIVTDSINGFSPVIEMDTMRALSKVTIKGHLEDFGGNMLNSFNGVLSPTIFDKPRTVYTLGQDPNSPVLPFELQRNIVYRGKATVSNGQFEFSFVVPKDINLSIDHGKISYYAANSSLDASGSDSRFYIGGIDPNGVQDNEGPEIDLFLNDDRFVSGGITDETPVLIAKLFDENGINTVGNGIGHDLTAVIDGETANPIVLNDYYTADMDTYQSGTIRYTIPKLDKGKHTLTVKVWDVNNNSSEQTIEFVVQEKQDVVLEHVLNYPNPFTTRTEFFFEHNQVCNEMEVQVQVLTVAGRLVKTINQPVLMQGFRSAGIPWDGRDDFGDQLAKGVYVYRIHVKTPDGKTAEKLEKLVLLR
jgi:hypothetical protein